MTIRFERDGAVGSILIDRPGKRNAMTQDMWDAMPQIVAQADADPAVRVIILTSATPGMFCAGADIGELLANKDDAAWRAANQAALNRTQYVLARTTKPTIAFIDGDSVGGGCGLALACDMRVATARARMGLTPAKLGLVYPLHDIKLLVDLIGPGQAKRLLFSSMLIDAAEALRIGLIEMIADSADDLAHAISDKSSHSTREMKGFVRRILDGQAQDNAETLAIFADAFTKPDFLTGAAAFAEKRKPDFT